MGLSGALQSSSRKSETLFIHLCFKLPATVLTSGAKEGQNKERKKGTGFAPLSWDYSSSDQRGTFPSLRVLVASMLLLLLLSLAGDVFSTSDSELEAFP